MIKTFDGERNLENSFYLFQCLFIFIILIIIIFLSFIARKTQSRKRDYTE